MSIKPIHIIGGGMAGSEAAWQAANAGVPVILHEMRGVKGTDAHQTDKLAELVCSNSFRSDDHVSNAVGVLHEEMRRANGLIMHTAAEHQVPAGSALAVDREGFAEAVTAKLEAHPNVTIVREEIAGLPPEDWDSVIVATGPLTSLKLAEAIHAHTGEDDLAFFDAIAPIVYFDSVDMTKAWRQSRYDKPGPGGDTAAYINCPLDEDQYNAFIDALISGEKTEFKEWAHGTLWNMVGFQTKLKYGAQTDIFRMIPGLEKAEFARLGGIHRNTFLNSPKLLDEQLRMKSLPRLRFAGQVTGVEGYVESAGMGLLAGRFAAAERLGQPLTPPPETTALGSLIRHITGGHLEGKATFQPMNVNFGLFPDITDFPKHGPDGKRLRGKDKGRAKKRAQAVRALEDFDSWLSATSLVPAE